jgi:hypothetical protein
VLSVPVVDLARVVRFIPFGAALPGSGVPNPAYEFVLSGTGHDVLAATAGVVSQIGPNDQGDSELHVTVPGTNYLVIYDHVLNVSVAVGQSLTPGVVLGKTGIWSPTQSRIELQINRADLSVCPRDLGTSDFNAAHAAALAAADRTQQNAAWTDVCLASTVQP